VYFVESRYTQIHQWRGWREARSCLVSTRDNRNPNPPHRISPSFYYMTGVEDLECCCFWLLPTSHTSARAAERSPRDIACCSLGPPTMLALSGAAAVATLAPAPRRRGPRAILPSSSTATSRQTCGRVAVSLAFRQPLHRRPPTRRALAASRALRGVAGVGVVPAAPRGNPGGLATLLTLLWRAGAGAGAGARGRRGGSRSRCLDEDDEYHDPVIQAVEEGTGAAEEVVRMTAAGFDTAAAASLRRSLDNTAGAAAATPAPAGAANPVLGEVAALDDPEETQAKERYAEDLTAEDMVQVPPHPAPALNDDETDTATSSANTATSQSAENLTAEDMVGPRGLHISTFRLSYGGPSESLVPP